MKKSILLITMALTTLAFTGCGTKETNTQPEIVVEHVEVEVKKEEPKAKEIEKDDKATKEQYDIIKNNCKSFFVREAFLNYAEYEQYAGDVDVALACSQEHLAIAEELYSESTGYGYDHPYVEAIEYFDTLGRAEMLNEQDAFSTFEELWDSYSELHNFSNMYVDTDGNIYFE